MVNDKNNIEEKDIILTRLIDEFVAEKRAGKKPTIEGYKKKYPKYAEEIEKELEEELTWSAQFRGLKQIPPFVSTEKELNRSWERFRTRMIWEPQGKSLSRTLTGSIEARILRAVQEIKIVIPDILKPILTPIRVSPALLGKNRTMNELEIPISDINGVLKISISSLDNRGNIQVNVQPTIKEPRIVKLIKSLVDFARFGFKPRTKESRMAKQIIPVIIKDRLKDAMVQRTAVRSGEIASFELSANKDYSICIEVGKEKKYEYEVPLRISESKENELTTLKG